MNKQATFGLVIVLAGALAGCGQTVEVQTAGYGQAGPTVALTTYPEAPVARAPFRISTEVGDDPTPEELAEDALNYIDPADYDRIKALPVGDPNKDSPYFSTTTSTTTTSTILTTLALTTTTTTPTTTTTLPTLAWDSLTAP